MPFIVATYVSASSQGQRTHSTRTKSSAEQMAPEDPPLRFDPCSIPDVDDEVLREALLMCKDAAKHIVGEGLHPDKDKLLSKLFDNEKRMTWLQKCSKKSIPRKLKAPVLACSRLARGG